MSTPFEQYTPRDLSALDALAAARRTADAILRSNPLTNAIISSGRMSWVGNHTDIDGDKVNFVWLGEFTPTDPTMGGIPQRGSVFWRDDSTAATVQQGIIAWALYDHSPGAGGLGLRQTIHSYSVDNNQLINESRSGGLRFPRISIPMGPGGGASRTSWHQTTSGSFVTVAEGACSGIGRHVYARYWSHNEGGTSGEFQVTASWPGGSASGPVHSQGGGASVSLREDTLFVPGCRGTDMMQVKIDARVTGGASFVAVAPLAVQNFTDGD